MSPTPMLYLYRHVGEKIMIGDSIEITVVRINPGEGKCRVGITAPPHVEIHRQEVAARIAAEGRTGPPRMRGRGTQS